MIAAVPRRLPGRRVVVLQDRLQDQEVTRSVIPDARKRDPGSGCMRRPAGTCMVVAERREQRIDPRLQRAALRGVLADSHRPAFDGMRGIGFLLVITAHIPSVPLFGTCKDGRRFGCSSRSAGIW